MADICLVSIVFRAQAMNIDIKRMPVIESIVNRCAVLDAFSSAHPLRQEGAPSK